jgi:hemoglobin
MRTHLQTPEIKADMFAHWLSLFDQVLAEELDAEIAERWSAVAHRIGAGMRIGVADRDAPKDAVPKLF